MAFHNTNYEIVELSSGANGPDVCGDGFSAATIHQVYCVSDGSVTISALGGGSMTVALTTGDKVDVLANSVNVGSGTFVGFRVKAQGRNNRLLG